MEGLQLPALCPGNACQGGGHTYGFIIVQELRNRGEGVAACHPRLALLGPTGMAFSLSLCVWPKENSLQVFGIGLLWMYACRVPAFSSLGGLHPVRQVNSLSELTRHTWRQLPAA